MGRDALIKPFPWHQYSKKLVAKIDNPHSVGIFCLDDANARQMRLVIGCEGELKDGNLLYLYWLVDPQDGMIVDAKFQAFGQSALIGAAECACELVIHKYYDQARRIGADLVDRHLRDRPDVPSFPPETAAHVNLVIDAIEKAAAQCSDIPLPANYVSPVPSYPNGEMATGEYPGWLELTVDQKLAVIEQVIESEIRPYIELDGGGIKLINLIEEQEVIIAYEGNCTSCFSSTGATLSYIQQTLRAKVYPSLTVVPDFGDLAAWGNHYE